MTPLPTPQVAIRARAHELLEVTDKALCILKPQFLSRRSKWELELPYLVLLCAGRQGEGVERKGLSLLSIPSPP